MNKTLLRLLSVAMFLAAFSLQTTTAQQSVARRWNELLLQAIRQDLARPPVQARNLLHLSVAMYDAWAAYDTVAQPYFLGKTWGNYTDFFMGVPKPADVEAARREAISYAAFRLLNQRFQNSPNAGPTLTRFNDYMIELGYNPAFTSADYSSGSPAELGNYIAASILAFGYNDGSNELGNYLPTNYMPVNPPMNPDLPGNLDMLDPNRWQPLNLSTAVDQNGNPIPSIQRFQSPEWGRVAPFAMTTANCDTFQRDGVNYYVYNDPGAPPSLDTAANGDPSDAFKWNNELVSVWSSHLDPNDGVMWDISPASIGNNQTPFPTTLAEYQGFYNLYEGGAAGSGRPVNPRTGQPYEPQVVPRGDYTRVLAQFWADGPNSETPPGHWFAIFNKVMDHPLFVRKFNGKGAVLDTLEYDVKAYLTLGGALHDAAVSAWGIKGWYDNGRPITSLRYMADLGQSSDPMLPHYHPAGLPLIPGYIELVKAGDPLAGNTGGHIGKIKVKAWKGPNSIANPVTDIGGVGWILAENWWPYQRKTFVTPPFAGYISGHSTYSRSAAEALTLLTGDEYFPGGMGEFHIAANNAFLGLEKGPSVDVTLQWATYRDASDQTSLSRIWGGIHPPVDDIPGRIVGIKCGTGAFERAKSLFYTDSDSDGFLSLDDCDDNNATVYPGAPERCDGLDNDCNGTTDDGIQFYTYYADGDGDGFGGVAADTLSSCQTTAPNGFAANRLDCDDANMAIHPGAPELCDGIDNDCNGMADDGIPFYTYYADGDGDGFGGVVADTLRTCSNATPAGYATNRLDCDDADATIHPGATEICDGIDNDCNGATDDGILFYTYYADGDGDGFGGVAADTLRTCSSVAPAGYVINRLDCDDANAAIHPGAPELCDGIDNDCNGMADDGIPFYTYYADGDGDGFGGVADTFSTCSSVAPTGYVTNRLDCDDANAAIHPGAPELCDGLDNNCNGMADDSIPFYTYYSDGDGDGFGGLASDTLSSCLNAAPAGYSTNRLDCNDANALIYPDAPELCDGLDNNCNGAADEGFPLFNYYEDADGDGFGASSSDTLITCLAAAPVGYAANRLDCNDVDPAIHPGAPEVLDSLDNDCNGLVDDVSAVHTPSLQISAAPNPVEDHLDIRLDVQGLVRMEMFDIEGRLLRNEKISFDSGLATVDFSSILPGVHVLKLYLPQTGQSWVLRVVKL